MKRLQIPTKRIDKFMSCILNDWRDGYENVVLCCMVEKQKNADDIEGDLDGVELVVVGAESDADACFALIKKVFDRILI